MIYINQERLIVWLLNGLAYFTNNDAILKGDDIMENQTYMTTEELAVRLRYDSRYIRSALKDTVFIEGIHYIRPFGRRRVLYIWENIERDMVKASMAEKPMIPMANGGVCYG